MVFSAGRGGRAEFEVTPQSTIMSSYAQMSQNYAYCLIIILHIINAWTASTIRETDIEVWYSRV